MPVSGTGRFHAYIQLKNPGPGEAKQVIMRALDLRGDLIKHIFVFDEDIDIFNPRDVMWSIATRTQWGRDIVIFPDTKTVALDPSCGPESIGDIGGIDCTKPWGEPYEVRVGVSQAVKDKIKLEDFVSSADLSRVNTERV
jgi:2,5-furandicarboxylate decarboxylase 1